MKKKTEAAVPERATSPDEGTLWFGEIAVARLSGISLHAPSWVARYDLTLEGEAPVRARLRGLVQAGRDYAEASAMDTEPNESRPYRGFEDLVGDGKWSWSAGGEPRRAIQSAPLFWVLEVTWQEADGPPSAGS